MFSCSMQFDVINKFSYKHYGALLDSLPKMENVFSLIND